MDPLPFMYRGLCKQHETICFLSSQDQLGSTKSNQEERVQQCMSEIRVLQNRVRESESQSEKLKSRFDAEKSLSRETRIENMKLKEDLLRSSSESEGKDQQIKDLRANIKGYVTEVKRIEELLSSREKERSELLEQYKYLSDEVDKSELYARQMEAKVSHLKLELSTRSSELKATESRLADMEQDLIELSLANEDYRSHVSKPLLFTSLANRGRRQFVVLKVCSIQRNLK